MIIAVDGPTASGKGTLAKALARHFGLPHLDTGLLYRAVGRQVFLNGGDPDDGGDALAAAWSFHVNTCADELAADRSVAAPYGDVTRRCGLTPSRRCANDPAPPRP